VHQKLTLAQALEKFSEPDLLASFDKAEAACRKWVPRRFGENVLFIGKNPRGYEPRIENWSIARKRLFDEFMNKLRTGKLLAFGFPHPVPHDAKSVQISSSHWLFLKPTFSSDDSIAEGGGLRFVGIWVEPRVEQVEGPQDPPRSEPPGPKGRALFNAKPNGAIPTGTEAQTGGESPPRRHGPIPTRGKIMKAAQRLMHEKDCLPGKTISWKEFQIKVCNLLNVKPGDRGYSLDTIQTAVRELKKRQES
jgi:hypothetical protein